jgi:hypothetical protein
MAITLDRNQYEALRSLLSELDDIEALQMTSKEQFAVCGLLSKDNINDLRKMMDLEELD